MAQLKGIAEVAHAIEVYTERHYKRLGRLQQSTFVLDFLLNSMQVYEALDGDQQQQQQLPQAPRALPSESSVSMASAAPSKPGAVTYSLGIAPLHAIAKGPAKRPLLPTATASQDPPHAQRAAELDAPGASPSMQQALQRPDALRVPGGTGGAAGAGSTADAADAVHTPDALAGWGAGFDSISPSASDGDDDASARQPASQLHRESNDSRALLSSGDESDGGLQHGAAGVGVLAPKGHHSASAAPAAVSVPGAGSSGNGKKKCRHRKQRDNGDIPHVAGLENGHRLHSKHMKTKHKHKHKRAHRGSEGDVDGTAHNHKPHKKRKRHSAPA